MHVNERVAMQATKGCLLSYARKTLPLPAPLTSRLDPELGTSHHIDSSVREATNLCSRSSGRHDKNLQG